jgi:hypothetical protein
VKNKRRVFLKCWYLHTLSTKIYCDVSQKRVICKYRLESILELTKMLYWVKIPPSLQKRHALYEIWYSKFFSSGPRLKYFCDAVDMLTVTLNTGPGPSLVHSTESNHTLINSSLTGYAVALYVCVCVCVCVPAWRPYKTAQFILLPETFLSTVV